MTELCDTVPVLYLILLILLFSNRLGNTSPYTLDNRKKNKRASLKLLAKKKLEKNNLHLEAGNDTFGVLVIPRFGVQGEYENTDSAAEMANCKKERGRLHAVSNNLQCL